MSSPKGTANCVRWARTAVGKVRFNMSRTDLGKTAREARLLRIVLRHPHDMAAFVRDVSAFSEPDDDSEYKYAEALYDFQCTCCFSLFLAGTDGRLTVQQSTRPR